MTPRQRKRARAVARRVAAIFERELAARFLATAPWLVEAMALRLNEDQRMAREARRALRAFA